jgi:superfamily II DNA or RNA helicase
VLILAPLAVSKQTAREGRKFGVDVNICRDQSDVKPGINITNYEMLHHFDPAHFAGVVLDESGILKAYTGKYRTQIIEAFCRTPYRLACTATPAPNDHAELGNHSEFLGVMSRTEMLSMFFINDAGDTGTWRLKGHAESEFWGWMCSWAVMIRKPSDLGYDDGKFQLPALNIENTTIKCDKPLSGMLFHMPAKTLSDRRKARKESMDKRCAAAAELANSNDEQWLIWCDLNDESAMLSSMIDGAVEVKGADDNEHKEKSLIGFANGEIRVLVSKPKIAGFGMNFQSCHNMIFVGLSDSYEAYYQAVRRCWRFGQDYPVNAHIITSELEGNVVSNIQRKEADAVKMAEGMVENMAPISSATIHSSMRTDCEYKTGSVKGEGWELINGDCVEVVAAMPDESIHYSIFSPPFASLFTYSNSTRDMGNCAGVDEFEKHFKFLVGELFRVIKQGRLLSFHCMNLPSTITHDGVIGMKDFRGLLIRMFEEAGFIYHSEVCIWKDPLIQATRTKTLTLAHKQISKDSAMCAQGYPDYIVTMRKPGKNQEPIAHGRGLESYAGEMPAPKDRKSNDPRINKYSHKVWQRYASPVWFDIRQTHTLNSIKADKDEKHVCPLQLDTIERCLTLWSNPGDTILSPFAGIGSEGYQSVLQGRKFVGVELKPAYFDQAVKNIRKAEKEKNIPTLFDVIRTEAAHG